ncbi:hypothetical protein Pfo_028954 [Paulownia fortunei]|nr:hypothetical protein Pfo_028954 [Paulownia fortunei]
MESLPIPHVPLPPFSTTLKPKIPKPKFSTIIVTLNSVDESPLTGRERRQMRNERRESKPAYKEGRAEFDNLALLGPQWWVVRVSRVSGQDTPKGWPVQWPETSLIWISRMALSVKPKPLFPGCVFLRCVMNKELHDFIRECDGVGGFVGSKVGNTKRQINKPRPVDADDMEAIYKQAKEEQEKADQAFEEEQQKDEALDSKKLGVDSPLVSQELKQTNAMTKPGGRGRKAAKQSIVGKATSLKPGSTVQVVSGAFAGFSGTLRSLIENRAGNCWIYTVWKETLADIDANEILAR